MTFRSVGEVKFVAVAVVPVEPLGYADGVKAGAKDPVLNVAGNFSYSMPFGIADGSRLSHGAVPW